MKTALSRQRLVLLLLALGVACASGCGHKATPAERLKEAIVITDVGQRDKTLREIADSAAAAGDAPSVKEALRTISNDPDRDAAAESCALALGKKSLVGDAMEVARMINDKARRDSTLAQLPRFK